jgi:hypothetical protein
MNGIELIAQERKEQIEKHGRSVALDVEHNKFDQLSEAAALLCTSSCHVGYDSDRDNIVPHRWDEDVFAKMMVNTYKKRLIIAGALIAAEIDRLQALEAKGEPTP